MGNHHSKPTSTSLRRFVRIFLRFVFVSYAMLIVLSGFRAIVYHTDLLSDQYFKTTATFLLIFLPIASAILAFFTIYDQERKSRKKR